MDVFIYQEPQVLYSGIVTALIIGFAIAGATAAFLLHQQQGNPDDLSNNNAVQVTKASEGDIITWIEGRVKVAGNIVQSGNKRTVEVKQKGGGKGFGGGASSAGGTFKVFLDVWYVICRAAPNVARESATVALIDTYVSQTPDTVQSSEELFNNGVNGVSPVAFFEKANAKRGVCHISYRQMFLGENANSVPNLQFVVEKTSLNPVDHANLPNGTNPAASCYDWLLESGTKTEDINLTSFNDFASFCQVNGYGINMAYTSQKEVKDRINELMNYVDGVFYRDREGKRTLRALRPTDTSVATITDKEVSSFKINRKTPDQIPNKFTITFIDEAKNFTTRTIIMSNPAAILNTGKEIPMSLDFKCFRDLPTVAKRAAEFCKRLSYGAASYQFKTFIKYSVLEVGDPFVISFDREFNGERLQFDANVRVHSIQIPEIGGVEVDIEAVERVELLHDDSFSVQGGSEAIEDDLSPVALDHVDFFELPFNPLTKGEPTFLLLGNRKKGFETGYNIYISTKEDEDFELQGSYSSFAMTGELVAEYPSSTFSVDDITGIEFNPANLNDNFDSISRDQLFLYNRVAVVGNELMAFQTVESLESGNIRLTGVVRGILNTPVETHAVGARIYLTDISSNLLTNVNLGSFYFKLIPKFLSHVVPLGDVTAVQATYTAKARQPREVSRIVAERVDANTVNFALTPNTPGIPGAGDSPASVSDSVRPYPFHGEFLVSYDAVVDEVHTLDEFTLTITGATDVTIKHKLNNFVSTGKIITVGASNGTYIL